MSDSATKFSNIIAALVNKTHTEVLDFVSKEAISDQNSEEEQSIALGFLAGVFYVETRLLKTLNMTSNYSQNTKETEENNTQTIRISLENSHIMGKFNIYN